MTISEERLTSPKYLVFLEKLASRYYWTAEDYGTIPDEMRVEIFHNALDVVRPLTPDEREIGSRLATMLATPQRICLDAAINAAGRILRADVAIVRDQTAERPIPGALVQLVAEVIVEREHNERTVRKAAYAAQGVPFYIIVDGRPGAHFADVYTLVGNGYELPTTVPADARMEFSEPFPFVLDMKQINS